MFQSSNQPRILVVGSSSVDQVFQTDHIPLPNETLLARNSESYFGGKGANQAIACSRLGAGVHFVGCVGMDPWGQQVLRNLRQESVNVDYVLESEEAPTGTAYVAAAQGVNTIIVVPAANSCLAPKDVKEAEKLFPNCDMVLLQLEIPMETVDFTIKLAKKYGKRVVVYAAPANKLSDAIRTEADFIVAKIKDLNTLFGEENPEDTFSKYSNRLILRDENNGTTYHQGSEKVHLNEDCTGEIHKMGMGDAFTAGFATALCVGKEMEAAVRFGNTLAKRVSQQKGSQSGLPRRSEFDGWK